MNKTTTTNVSTTCDNNGEWIILDNSIGTSSYKFIKSLDLTWNPQEDITVFELAKSMNFLLRVKAVSPNEFDKSAAYARHWKVNNPNI